MTSGLSLHFEKHTKDSMYGLIKHDEREQYPLMNHSNENINKDLTWTNIRLKREDGPISERWNDIMEIQYKGKRTPRKDAAALVETTVQFGGDIAEADTDVQIEILRNAHEWLTERFGEANVLSSTIHLDETTPHLHFGFVPITEDGRLSAKDVLNRQALRDVQKDFLEHMQNEFPFADFQREGGNSRGFSNGKTQKDYERLSEAHSALLTRENELDTRERDISQYEAHMDSRKASLDEQEKSIKEAFSKNKKLGRLAMREYERLSNIAINDYEPAAAWEIAREYFFTNDPKVNGKILTYMDDRVKRISSMSKLKDVKGQLEKQKEETINKIQNDVYGLDK